jgi:lipid-binding SYLF domain-containing protein
MTRIRQRALITIAAALIAAPALAGEGEGEAAAAEGNAAEATTTATDDTNDEAERAQRSADVLQAAVEAEDGSIPQNLLQRAWGVAVIPHVVKGALGIGGRWGKGLVVQRHDDGSWSSPAFVSVGGASYGFQIGVEATDLVLIFTDRTGLDSLLDDKLKLGADATVTAGPLGRKAEVGTNLTLDSAIYAYSRSKGLFAGVALDGAVLTLDDDANRKVYGAKISHQALLRGHLDGGDAVAPFLKALRKHVPAREA